MTPSIGIHAACNEAHFVQMAQIIADYFVWIRTRYADQPWLVDQVATAQSLDTELAGLSMQYAPPRGAAFIAEVDGALAGAGAWRHHALGISEMKRVFVRDGFKGLGVGRRLCEAVMLSARDAGYACMRLDTLTRMTEARALYATLGFGPCPPYLDYPADVLASLDFMEAALPGMSAGGAVTAPSGTAGR